MEEANIVTTRFFDSPGVYLGSQTRAALENFPVSGVMFPVPFLLALVHVKSVAAQVNRDSGRLDARRADAVIAACDELRRGDILEHFPLDIFQTGSGTSTNMNANEAIAARANAMLTGRPHPHEPVHPNDHVNLGQSSNDVIPTVIHLAAVLEVRDRLLPALHTLVRTLDGAIGRHGEVVKTGRTHLMDAMPITFGQELSGWRSQVDNARGSIARVLPRLYELAVGGTAVGTGVNTGRDFGARVAAKLAGDTGIPFRETLNHFAAQASQDAATDLSGTLRTYATALIKIADDLRWMNSGPAAGLAEIEIRELQPGSSIMPGKVNPVIPESTRMACVQAIGNDTVIALANSMGEFQLNVMLPLIAHALLQSIAILASVTQLLAERTIATMTVNTVHCEEALQRNPVLATVLTPKLGYDTTAAMVRRALHERRPVLEIVVELGLLSADEAAALLDPRRMTGV